MSDDETEIRNLVSTWTRATEEHQYNMILELMDEDAIFMATGQPALKGKRSFKMVMETLKDFDVEASSRIQEIKVSGDLAYCWNHLTVKLKPKTGRNMVSRTGNILSILEKKQGKWVITRDANMLAVIE